MAAGARLGALAADPDVDGTLRMEALTTIGAMKAIDQLPIVQDLITDDWPALRAAAIRAAAAIDPDTSRSSCPASRSTAIGWGVQHWPRRSARSRPRPPCHG